MTNPTLHNPSYPMSNTLLLSLEIGASKWKLCFSDGSHMRIRNVDAQDFQQLEKEMADARRKFGLPASARLLSVYEAGRDGFCIHRRLVQLGVESIVTDSASIEVSRKKRKAKTDKLDAERLVNLLRRYAGGELKALCPVRVPTVEEEDARRPMRLLERLKEERTAHINRIKGLLALVGVKPVKLLRFEKELDADVRIPPHLKKELKLEYARMALVCEQLSGQESEVKASITAAQTPAAQKISRLMQLCGVAWIGGATLVGEFFGWRKFKNRREVGSLAGLAPTPFDSGDGNREQGISKAGNKRIRKLMCQLAWGWLRHQPNSKDTQWFNARFAAGKRMKKIGITALARRLLVALWRYVEQGVMPEGAVLKG